MLSPAFGVGSESRHCCILRQVSVALKEREARLECGGHLGRYSSTFRSSTCDGGFQLNKGTESWANGEWLSLCSPGLPGGALLSIIFTLLASTTIYTVTWILARQTDFLRFLIESGVMLWSEDNIDTSFIEEGWGPVRLKSYPQMQYCAGTVALAINVCPPKNIQN